MPTNSQTDAQFTAIEFIDNDWQIDLISLPYDINKLLNAFQTSGVFEKYPFWAKLLAMDLKTGINYPVKGLVRALGIANSQNETLSEDHWKQACEELGVY